MNKKAIVSATVAVAAVIIVIAVVLGSRGLDSPELAPDTPAITANGTAAASETVPSTLLEPTGEVSTVTQVTTVPAASEPSSTDASGSTAALTDVITTTAAVIKGTISEYFTLPQAPKYVPRESRIDFTTAKLASYKYSPEGNFYYTDDKDCWQKNFGFNAVYDKLAPVGHIYYDTVRNSFEYEGKKWRIQLWKGQYGYYFVGGEIGIYTQDAPQTGDHYVCADKPDWLNMEMTVYWDTYRTGNYVPVLTRNYEKYWWCTGFVLGWEDVPSDRSDLRLVARITFKDIEMANAFCAAFEANGFRRSSSLGISSLDCFLQVGKDVAFVWQNIH